MTAIIDRLWRGNTHHFTPTFYWIQIPLYRKISLPMRANRVNRSDTITSSLVAFPSPINEPSKLRSRAYSYRRPKLSRVPRPRRNKELPLIASKRDNGPAPRIMDAPNAPEPSPRDGESSSVWKTCLDSSMQVTSPGRVSYRYLSCLSRNIDRGSLLPLNLVSPRVPAGTYE